MTGSAPTKTLRLLMPQWQGGNNPPYHFGAELLSWLAPPTSGPVETVPVAPPSERPLVQEDGILAKAELLDQQDAAFNIIRRHNPDRIAVLGGDCLVDLVPFAYLNERYAGELAILWIDAHPDIMTAQEFERAHAMVLGNLLGNGDKDFLKFVSKPVDPTRVMYAGLKERLPVEDDFLEKHSLRFAGPDELASNSDPVLKWIQEVDVKHVAIHFDLDVLDPNQFRSLLFANPADKPGTWDGVAQGSMTIDQVIRLISDVAAVTDVVGLGITEHLPWDALAMRNMMRRLPLLSEQ